MLSQSGSVRNKELTPWDDSEGVDTPDGGLTLEAACGNSKGWRATEMFKKNEEVYGVKSSFDEKLSGYTTQVDMGHDEFTQFEKQANQITMELTKRGRPLELEESTVECEDKKEEYLGKDPQRNSGSANLINKNSANEQNHISSQSVVSKCYLAPPLRKRNSNIKATASAQAQQSPTSSTHVGSLHVHTTNNSGPSWKPMSNQNPNLHKESAASVVNRSSKISPDFDYARVPPPPIHHYNHISAGGNAAHPPFEVPGRGYQMNKQAAVDFKNRVMQELAPTSPTVEVGTITNPASVVGVTSPVEVQSFTRSSEIQSSAHSVDHKGKAELEQKKFTFNPDAQVFYPAQQLFNSWPSSAVPMPLSVSPTATAAVIPQQIVGSPTIYTLVPVTMQTVWYSPPQP